LIIPKQQITPINSRLPITEGSMGVKSLIHIHTHDMGQDLVFIVTGGTAHIGAMATAYMSGDQIVHSDVLVVPGHREGELAVELARMACCVLKRTVAVLVGIHLDQPTKQEIEDIVIEAIRTMAQFLDQ
jgi:hypothetical protein